jgi:hypothetical protein
VASSGATPERATTLVDSCVLLDILTDDPQWADWSDDALAAARDLGPIVINPIIYAEVAGGFDTIEDLDAAVPETELRRADLPYQAGFVASKAFLAYRRRGGEHRQPALAHPHDPPRPVALGQRMHHVRGSLLQVGTIDRGATT